MQAQLHVRIDDANPDHHLWRNGRTWWIHYTLAPSPGRRRRIRHSLQTRCLEEARSRRDSILAALASGASVSEAAGVFA